MHKEPEDPKALQDLEVRSEMKDHKDYLDYLDPKDFLAYLGETQPTT